MPKYKLTYFNIRVRGEVTRMLLAMGGVEYEDFRFDRPEFNTSIKPTMPFGQVPVLEVDGKQISQSLAIERYLAGKFGLSGDTNAEKAQVDACVDAIQDIRVLLDAEFRTQIPELKEDIRQRLYDKVLPAVFQEFEKTMTKNKSQFLVGNKLTVADLSLADTVSILTLWQSFFPRSNNGDFAKEMEKYPKLQELIKHVESVPQIAEWIRKRPQTPM